MLKRSIQILFRDGYRWNGISSDTMGYDGIQWEMEWDINSDVIQWLLSRKKKRNFNDLQTVGLNGFYISVSVDWRVVSIIGGDISRARYELSKWKVSASGSTQIFGKKWAFTFWSFRHFDHQSCLPSSLFTIFITNLPLQNIVKRPNFTGITQARSLALPPRKQS